MATVGIWKIESRLNKVIDYASDTNKTSIDDLDNLLNYVHDDVKTEQKLYVDGINCNPLSSLKEMRIIKKRFNKENGILGFHAYQSFKEGEVTPEEAHKIGIELANEMWGDRFQVIVATHLNTNHLHNHFVINSVSFVDGKRYYDNRSNYAELRRINDEICREHGLSLLNEKKTRKGINYANYQSKNNSNMNYYKSAKLNLDIAISQAHNYNDFLQIMDNMNYDVILRSGKLSIRDRDYKRNIRIERYYGEDYSIENIKKQIAGIYIPTNRSYYRDKSLNLFTNKIITGNKNLLRIYIKYLHVLNLYPKYVKKNKISSELKQDIMRMDELSEQARLLASNNIETDEQFFSFYDEKNQQLHDLINVENKNEIDHENINKLRKQIKLLESIRQRKEEVKNNVNNIEKEVMLDERIR